MPECYSSCSKSFLHHQCSSGQKRARRAMKAQCNVDCIMQYDGVQYDSVRYSVFWGIVAQYNLLQCGRVRLLLVLCHFGTFPVVCHFVQFPGQINFSGPMLRPHKSVLTTAFQKLHQFKAIKQIFAKWLQLEKELHQCFLLF